MPPVRKTVQVTLNLTLELLDIDPADLSAEDVNVDDFEALPAERQTQLLEQVRENAQAMMDATLLRPDLNTRVVPALLASLIEADLGQLVQNHLGLDADAISEIDHETLSQIWGPAGDRLRAAEKQGDLWNPAPYLKATTLELRDLHIHED